MQVGKRYNNKAGEKGWIKGIILIIAWILIFSMARDLSKVKKGYLRIEDSKKRLEAEEKKNSELKEKLSLVMTDEYKERLVREQLNMQKIGEVVAVLPKDGVTMENGVENTESSIPNWKKWWLLLR